MNTQLLFLALGALVALSAATCTNQVCRCKTDSVEVGSYDGNGCYTCYCALSTAAASTAAPTTAKATTRAASATTAAAATTRAASTAAATTAKATTAAPTTVRATTAKCGALPSCECSSSEVIVYSTDARGCPSSCQCTASPSTARASTAAPTTVRATTAAAATCAPAAPCACFRNDDVQTWVTDAKGCRSCVCVAATTVAPTTARVATTTKAAAVCAPLSVRDNCNCAPGSVKYYRTDAWGCLVCGCQAVTTIAPATTARASTTTARATTAAPTTARATAAPATTARATAAPATTARVTTAAPTTARATTTLGSAAGCGTARQCKCASGATVMWDVDSNGCAYCYCAASSANAADTAVPSSAAGSGSDGSASNGTSGAFVPVVVALGCVCALMVAVIAVYRFKSNHGRFPWTPVDETSLEARV